MGREPRFCGAFLRLINTGMLELIHHFKIYKAVYTVPDQLISDLYAYKETDEGLRKTSLGGWHSKTFNLTKKYDSRSYEWTRNTVSALEDIVKQTWAEVYFDRGWFNINGLGAGNRWHDHGEHPVVGVFYIKVPKNSGSIEFCLNNETFAVTPTTGDFIVFPGNLQHRVLESKSNETRISMAVNFNKV